MHKAETGGAIRPFIIGKRAFAPHVLYLGSGLNAHVAQLVEHVLGKDEVTGSIPVVGSRTRSADIEQTLKLNKEHG